MAKKKTTTKKTAKKAAPKKGVNKTQAIKKALTATPNKLPKQISEELTAKGIDVSPGYVSTIKTSMKAEAEASQTTPTKKAAPKRKSVKAKRVTKKKAAPKKKVTRKKPAAKKPAAQTPPPSKITYEQLQQAKELAQQLGGLDKAREALAALSNLQE
jgi:hypothetical protein